MENQSPVFSGIVSLPKRQARPGGLSVSAMGLGCMGMSEFYGPSDEAQSRDLLGCAIERGVRFFDTADIYGFGHNETLVGSVLRDHPLRSQIVLATKGGILRDRNDPALRGVNTTPEYIRGAIARSLDRLQTPIDLYYLHRVEDDGAHIEETMAALADEMRADRIGAVGLSEAKMTGVVHCHASMPTTCPETSSWRRCCTTWPQPKASPPHRRRWPGCCPAHPMWCPFPVPENASGSMTTWVLFRSG